RIVLACRAGSPSGTGVFGVGGEIPSKVAFAGPACASRSRFSISGAMPTSVALGTGRSSVLPQRPHTGVLGAFCVPQRGHTVIADHYTSAPLSRCTPCAALQNAADRGRFGNRRGLPTIGGG